tara:strand:+ start:3729 stop:4310 length:582 start_codon:yes stop_codon:yes gene_type:complete
MRTIVVTGRIATGKSTILKQFSFLGVNSFSSDEMVNEIYNRDNEFFLKIKNLYPQSIEKGKINKKILSNLAFKSEDVLSNLEHIIYPKLIQKRVNIIKSSFLNNISTIVFEIPLLFEKKISEEFSIIVSTTCNKKLQLQRYLRRKNTNLKKFNLINNNFFESSKRLRNSDYIINTGNGMHHSLLSIKKIMKKV